MISDSELSDDFSLDTVGSYGDVKCKGRYKDYLVRFPPQTSTAKVDFVIKYVDNDHLCASLTFRLA